MLHLHEPMTPTICLTALIRARCPIVATFHASGDLGWMRTATPVWGFLIDRIDHRIAVSERARASQARWLPGEYEVIPNGVLVPDAAPAGGREHRSSSPGATSRARGCRCCCERGRRSGGGRSLRLTRRGRRSARGTAAAHAAARPRRRHRRRRLPRARTSSPHTARARRRSSRRRSGRRASAWC